VKAIVVRQHGDPSVLCWDEVADPEPGEGQVRIAVHAAGTNPVDAGIRADGTWAGTALPWVPGYDVAGVIDAVGPGVTDLAPGSRVAAMTQFPGQGGGYAEFAVVDAAEAALLADSVSFVAAAAVPLAGGTAWEVIERLALPRGARLLVLGASGGVGSFLLQLAAVSGIEAVAVGRREHHDRLRRLGAVATLDYTDGQATSGGGRADVGRVDAIADLVGGSAPARWLTMLRDYGQIASIQPPELDLDALLDANVTFHGVLIGNRPARTRTLVDMLATGDLTAHVPHVLPLSEAEQAHRLLEGGHAGGKVVLVAGSGE
jgi:NADPH:quinone reductase